MGSLRVLYKLDGVQTYETIDPKMVDYNGRIYVDSYAMLRNAQLYADSLADVGARDVKIEWDMNDEKSCESRAM